MRILVEALGISKYGGGRSATIPLFEALLPLASDDDFVFVLDKFEPTLDFPNVKQVVVPIRNRFLARIWAQVKLPRLTIFHNIDLVHFAKNLTVEAIPAKTLVTIYDLTLLQYPSGFSWVDLLYWRYIQPRLLHRMSEIHTISENTANELKRFYHLSDDRIRIIPPPYRTIFKPQSAAVVSAIRKKYNLPKQIIMHVGSFSPKKNLDTLIRAFAKIVQKCDLHLVLIGGPYRPGFDEPIRKLVLELGLSKRVIFTGSVPIDDLPPLMASSRVMVYPSLHEGFGIVAVEAMACGIPLIVAPGGALQDAIGKGALVLSHALDTDELASAILKLNESSKLREKYIKNGLLQVKLFRPETVARQLLALYHSI